MHPFNPLLPLRVISSIKNEEMKWKATLKLFDACWRDGIDISDEKNIDQLLKEIQLNSKEIFENLIDARELLKLQTEQSIKDGIFGVPSFRVENEVFWGQDRIEFLKEFLEGKDPYCEEKYQKKLKNILDRPTKHRKIKSKM